MCPRQESNLHQKLRKLLFYPLNYESLDSDYQVFVKIGSSLESQRIHDLEGWVLFHFEFSDIL